MIEQRGKAMEVKTRSRLPLAIGSAVEATGFPLIEESVRLENATLRAAPGTIGIEARRIGWEEAASGHYALNLVSMEGEVVGVVHDARVDLFVLLANGHLFSATLRHGSQEKGQEARA